MCMCSFGWDHIQGECGKEAMRCVKKETNINDGNEMLGLLLHLLLLFSNPHRAPAFLEKVGQEEETGEKLSSVESRKPEAPQLPGGFSLFFKLRKNV